MKVVRKGGEELGLVGGVERRMRHFILLKESSDKVFKHFDSSCLGPGCLAPSN